MGHSMTRRGGKWSKKISIFVHVRGLKCPRRGCPLSKTGNITVLLRFYKKEPGSGGWMLNLNIQFWTESIFYVVKDFFWNFAKEQSRGMASHADSHQFGTVKPTRSIYFSVLLIHLMFRWKKKSLHNGFIGFFWPLIIKLAIWPLKVA